MAKGLRKPIARLTDTREDKKLQRVFVDLSGKMAVPNIGENRETLIVRDDHIHTNVLSSEEVGRGQCVRIIPSRGSSRRYTIDRYVRSIR